MSNRIKKKFETLRAKGKKAFIAFITAGDPSLKTTEELVLSFEHSGVDIVELGVPFSDPLADGPTIQAASQRALNNGVTLQKILDTVRHIRKRSSIPLALMSYYNPIFHYGEKQFMAEAGKAGVDGLIVPDLPPEEAGSLIKLARQNCIATVFFLSPTTTLKRMKGIVRISDGFIYYVSLTGVTGARQKLPDTIVKNVKLAKRLTDKPICVGFGISTAAQVKLIAQVADGVIVGSAIVQEIFKNKGKNNLVRDVSRYVAKLTGALA
ncbi:MAG: tryptophan synthase subunit alpha [Candidatus Omnitrophota bacterium]